MERSAPKLSRTCTDEVGDDVRTGRFSECKQQRAVAIGTVVDVRGLVEMERAKGFEPSTLTLAT